MTGLGWTLAAVLGASLLGSLHCVGMCGGFVASVSGSCRRADRRRSFGPLIAYQAARGLAYVILGALAGVLGAGLDASAAIVGITRAAGPLMGLVLIGMAVASLRGRYQERFVPAGCATADRRRDHFRPSQVRLPSECRHSLEGATPITIGARPRRRPLDRLRLRLATAVREHGATAGAAAGLLTALLPCGWLWAYLAVAASTGSVAGGSLVMAAFWLGSVPALLGVGLLAGELGRRLGRHAPRITAAVLLTLGVLSLAGKLTITPIPAEPAPDEPTPGAPASAELPHDAPCH
ncbi:MAG: sulfite exporter TauE/SafE family protein [Enhygromyxa sp.]